MVEILAVPCPVLSSLKQNSERGNDFNGKFVVSDLIKELCKATIFGRLTLKAMPCRALICLQTT